MNNTKKNVIIIPKKRTYKKRKDLEDNSNVKLNMSKNVPNIRLNEKFVQLMSDLSFIMKKRKDFMRAKAYSNAKETISNFKGDIIDPEQLKCLPGIGNNIFEKLKEFNNTGTLQILKEEEELILKNKALSIFTDIYGVGEKKAEELIDKNILTIEELEKKKLEVLNEKQIIGLKYYNDILQRIPRNEIEEYEKIFLNNFPKNDGNMEIVGSFRRGSPNSGDIDVIITSENNSTFETFIKKLLDTGIIIEVLSKGPSKCLVITKLPNSQYARRVDFLFTSPNEFPFAILYFTGSKEFNTAMRERALKMGYTLNEHGFSKMEGRKKGDKLDRVFKSEKEIFDFLKMKYKNPEERNDPSINEIESDSTKNTVSEPKNIVKVKRTTKKKREKICELVNNNNSIDSLILKFKSEGIQILKDSSESQLSDMIKVANNAFHCKGSPVMSDNEYDILSEYFSKKFPKNNVVNEVGASVEKNKVTLPYEMWSMDKIKPDTNVLLNWMKKYDGPYVLSCKLDGVSGLYTTEGDIPKLFTRGDGKIGQDITHIIPFLQLPTLKNIVIRGEFIIPKEIFEEKYKSKFSNPRNLVAGIVNQKTKDSKMNDIHFIGYEVIKHPDFTDSGIKPSQQMKLLEQMNVKTVKHKFLESLSNETLSNILQEWRNNYSYEIDGIIVSDDKVYPRLSGNPKHSFAFKMVLSDQIAEAHVVDVIWTPSKDGYLKPRVQIMPIQLGGVTITYATGFNAAFIESNKIGIGAIIMLVRSGDVIPYIKSVTTPAEKPKMPNIEYVWNDSHIDIMLKDKTGDSTVLEKNITGFFKSLEVEGLGSGNVTKIIKGGYDSIPKILHMKVDDFLKIEGFKEKMANKIYNSIQEEIKSASITKIMAASNIFGRGFSNKKIELIMSEYPEVLKSGEPDINKILKIKGIERKTGEAFISHIGEFKEFLKLCNLTNKLNDTIEKPKIYMNTYLPLNNKNVVITGFRSKDLEEKLKKIGANLSSTVNKKTFILIVKDLENNSSKIEQAKKLGIKIIDFDQFSKTYL